MFLNESFRFLTSVITEKLNVAQNAGFLLRWRKCVAECKKSNFCSQMHHENLMNSEPGCRNQLLSSARYWMSSHTRSQNINKTFGWTRLRRKVLRLSGWQIVCFTALSAEETSQLVKPHFQLFKASWAPSRRQEVIFPSKTKQKHFVWRDQL